jgi:hypothetical protein
MAALNLVVAGEGLDDVDAASAAAAGVEGVPMPTVTLYRLSGLAVMIGMTIDGLASFLYSRAGGVALYLDPLVPINDLVKLFGSLIFPHRAARPVRISGPTSRSARPCGLCPQLLRACHP